MTNVASLELCKELYELSGWEADYVHAAQSSDPDLPKFLARSSDGELGHDIFRLAPAYDLGYLLRKLPSVRLQQIATNFWEAQAMYDDGTELPDYKSCDADTPEDAACLLAIELLKSGVLTSEQKTPAKASPKKENVNE